MKTVNGVPEYSGSIVSVITSQFICPYGDNNYFAHKTSLDYVF